MRNTIIVSVCLFLAVIALSIFYFTDLGKEHKDATKPLTYLPEETLLIASLKNDETTDHIFRDFEVFDALLGSQQIHVLAELKNSLLRSSKLNPYLAGTELYISFHEVDKDIKTLYTIPTVEPIAFDDLSPLLGSLTEKYDVNRQDTLGQALYTFTPSNSDSTLYASYLSDVFFVSRSKQLLTQVIDKKNKKLDQQQIDYFFAHTNRNVPLSIYYPHQQAKIITQQFLRNKPGDFARLLLDLRGQSTWNINYKQDALMLTGESNLGETENSYIALFANQSKTSQRLYNYYPANTGMSLAYSVSNLGKFRTDLAQFLDKRTDNKQLKAQLANLQKTAPTAIDDVAAVLGQEFSIIELNNRNYIGFVSIQDLDALQQNLDKIAETVQDSMYRFKHSNTLYATYGDAFKPFVRPFFTIIDDIIVFSNYQSTLSEYQRSWNRRDLLTGTLGFKNFERLQGNEANITFFLHTNNAGQSLINLLTPRYAKNFNDKKNFGYRDFYSWSAQLSGNGGNFVSSIYAIYKSSTALGATADWTYRFKNRLITRPYIFEHSDTTQFILAQEQDHTVHAIHPSGTKMWSAVFHGRVVGDVTQLPDRSIVLATDKNRLYRFDTDGKTLPGFSLGMPHQPTGSPTVLSVHGSPVILVPASDRLLAYDMEGRELVDWKDVQIAGKILDGIYASGDMIVLGSTYGRVYFIDFQGNQVKEFDAPGDIAFRSQLGLIKRNNQDVFVTTDTTGTYYQFNYEKGIQPYRMANLTRDHQSYFQNISGSEGPEMVIIDGHKLHVFDVSDTITPIFEHNFTRDIIHRPLFFPSGRNMSQLGIASSTANLIYLFTENGRVAEGFPIEGMPLFYYGKINYNSSNYLLSTRRDHILSAYKH